MADLVLNNVRKSYGEVEVIKGIDLEIAHGEFVVFVGPSGCGKSTLLRMIAGLEDISSGELRIGGELRNDTPPSKRGIAMVFQSYALFPHMTVFQNIGFGLELAKLPKAEVKARVHETARILQIENLLDRRPAHLSGGQRQRVAIGRAIVRNPEVFLFDEPLSNLDAALRGNMRVEIAKLHQDLGATMIYVTHDQVEAMTLADRIVVLNGGVVQQVGTPLELYKKPANLFVAGFIGSPRMNFLPVSVTRATTRSIVLGSEVVPSLERRAPTGDWDIGAEMTLGVRPHDLHVADTGKSGLDGTVVLVERLGNETMLDIRLMDGTNLSCAMGGDVDIQTGSNICIGIDPEKVHLFDADGTVIT